MMILCYAAIAVLFIVAMFLLFKVDTKYVVNQIYAPIEKRNKRKIREAELSGKKLTGSLKRHVASSEMIAYTGKGSMATYQVATIVFAIIGALIGFAASNFFLALALGVSMAFIPFSVLSVRTNRHSKKVFDALESALHTVTNRYVQNGDFIRAVKESIDIIPAPIDKAFKRVIFEVDNINPSISEAVTNLRTTYNNPLWRDWCDTVIQCQVDSQLRSSLTGIVDRISEVKRAQYEMDTIVANVYREYFSMVLLVVGGLLFVMVVMPEWSAVLFTTLIGKIALALIAVVILITLIFIVRFNKPIEYN